VVPPIGKYSLAHHGDDKWTNGSNFVNISCHEVSFITSYKLLSRIEQSQVFMFIWNDSCLSWGST
jgi:hypothetical protein